MWVQAAGADKPCRRRCSLRSRRRTSRCGEVDSATPAGSLVRVAVRLDCGPGVEVRFGGEGEVISLITRASAEELVIEPGKKVTAGVNAAAVHVLIG